MAIFGSHNWAIRGMNSLEEELERYSRFWRDKILKNIQLDKENTARLENAGWDVLRLWESDIKDNIEKCATLVEKRYRAAVANCNQITESNNNADEKQRIVLINKHKRKT